MHTFVSMGQMCTHLDGLDLEQKKKQVILFVLITSLLNIYEFIIKVTQSLHSILINIDINPVIRFIVCHGKYVA